MKTCFRARSIASLVSAALAVTMLSGCTTLRGEDELRNMAVGECFDDPAADANGLVDAIETVPCSDPHDNEAFAVFDIDADSYPGETDIFDVAETRCVKEFEDFVGVSYDQSEFYYKYFYPSEASWAEGDKEVVCMIYRDGSKTRGSLEGANR